MRDELPLALSLGVQVQTKLNCLSIPSITTCSRYDLVDQSFLIAETLNPLRAENELWYRPGFASSIASNQNPSDGACQR